MVRRLVREVLLVPNVRLLSGKEEGPPVLAVEVEGTTIITEDFRVLTVAQDLVVALAARQVGPMIRATQGIGDGQSFLVMALNVSSSIFGILKSPLR